MFGKTGDVYIQTEMDIHGLDIQFSGSYSDSELLIEKICKRLMK